MPTSRSLWWLLRKCAPDAVMRNWSLRGRTQTTTGYWPTFGLGTKLTRSGPIRPWPRPPTLLVSRYQPPDHRPGGGENPGATGLRSRTDSPVTTLYYPGRALARFCFNVFGRLEVTGRGKRAALWPADCGGQPPLLQRPPRRWPPPCPGDCPSWASRTCSSRRPRRGCSTRCGSIRWTAPLGSAHCGRR